MTNVRYVFLFTLLPLLSHAGFEVTAMKVDTANAYSAISVKDNRTSSYTHTNEITPVKGMVLLTVDTRIRISYSGNDSSGKIDMGDVLLTIDKTDYKAFTVMSLGLARVQDRRIEFRKVKDAPKQEILRSIVFQIPATALKKKAKVRISGVSASFTTPDKTIPRYLSPPNPDSFKITTVENCSEIKSVYYANGTRVPSIIRPTPGCRIVAVTFEVDNPKADSEGEFYFFGEWVGCSTDNGCYTKSIGEKEDNNSPSTSSNETIRKNEDGTWKEEVFTYYFSIPLKAKSFTLTLQKYPVATCALPALTEPEKAK